MSKTYRAVIVLIVVVVAGYVGWRLYEHRRETRAGILSEHIERNGDIWTADYKVRIAAPVPAVFDAIKNIEKTHSDEVKSVTVVSQTANSKTVDMELAGPAGQTIKTELAFEYDPAGNRISYRTVGNPMLVTEAEYKFTPDGGATVISYHETTRMLQQIPVPDGVVKQVIQSVFISQMASLKHALNITDTSDSEEPSDEP